MTLISLSYKQIGKEFDIEEIDKLIKADLNTKAQKRARELFVFALYTGLSYSDVIQLKLHQIQIAKDNTKYILKKVAKNYLPDEVIHRKKAGFGGPIREWIRKDLDEMILFFGN